MFFWCFFFNVPFPGHPIAVVEIYSTSPTPPTLDASTGLTPIPAQSLPCSLPPTAASPTRSWRSKSLILWNKRSRSASCRSSVYSHSPYTASTCTLAIDRCSVAAPPSLFSPEPNRQVSATQLDVICLNPRLGNVIIYYLQLFILILNCIFK